MRGPLSQIATFLVLPAVRLVPLVVAVAGAFDEAKSLHKMWIYARLRMNQMGAERG